MYIYCATSARHSYFAHDAFNVEICILKMQMEGRVSRKVIGLSFFYLKSKSYIVTEIVKFNKYM